MDETQETPAAPPVEGTEAPKPPRDERVVDIGGGLAAPIYAVLAAADPNCRFCTGGLVKTKEADGEEHTRICACGPTSLRRSYAAEQRDIRRKEVAARLLIERGDQLERTVRKIDALTRELEQQRANLAEREEAFNASQGSVTARLQDLAAEEIIATHKLDTLAQQIADAEKKVKELREAHGGARESLQHIAADKKNALEEERRLDANRERFARDTAGIRHDIEKLARRISLARARTLDDGPVLAEAPPAA